MDNYFNVSTRHSITVANRNNYKFSAMHPERKMREHDFIYILEGEWKIGQNEEAFYVKKDDVLILGANNHHYGIAPCSPGTKRYLYTLLLMKTIFTVRIPPVKKFC